MRPERAREVRQAVRERVTEDLMLSGRELPDEDVEAYVAATVRDVMRDELGATAADVESVAQAVSDDLLRLGPLEALLSDPDVTDVMVNPPRRLPGGARGRIATYAVRRGRFGKEEEPTVEFDSDAHVRQVIDRIGAMCNRAISEERPMMSARLADGSRVQCAIPPANADGCSITIRKFSEDAARMEDLVSGGTLSEPMARTLAALVRARANVLVSGSTGAGKTTMLNVLSSFIPENERIVTIEDTCELQLSQAHVLRHESQPANSEGAGEVTAFDLLSAALREFPERIIVGEVRDKEAEPMLEAMGTGHDGSMSTIHANGSADVFERLRGLVRRTSPTMTAHDINRQIAAALDVVVHVALMPDGVRRVEAIECVGGTEDGVIAHTPLFRFENQGFDGRSVHGRFVACGFLPPERLMGKIEASGTRFDPEWLFEGGGGR